MRARRKNKDEGVFMGKNLFEEYPSNTVAGTCNNCILRSSEIREITGRVFYRVRQHGRFSYRFYFCNAVDSTYSNGTLSWANLTGDRLEVVSAFSGDGGIEPGFYDGSTLVPVKFGGAAGRVVEPGEAWWSDDTELNIPEGHYLVFQWTVRGKNIPYTPDKIIPSYRLVHGEWQTTCEFPQPCLVGCRRPVRMRLTFLGDSITQGLSTRNDLYEFWVAKIASHLPQDIAVWNIGLGYGCARDAATDRYWLAKAKTSDLVSVCFGVNDVLQWRSEAQVESDLKKIVTSLKSAGVRVGIFTIPPFDYPPAAEIVWRNCNAYIRRELAPLCEYCFDVSPYLGLKPPYDYLSRFGGHPSYEGCRLLAEGFVKQVTL